MAMLTPDTFDKPPDRLAQFLLGKVLRRKFTDPELGPVWLSARIIETEAYFRSEKGSHSSLGFTEKRKGMFMDPGTIYMYYARGGDSLNFSARGEGNGVLIKSGFAWLDRKSPTQVLPVMQRLNPGSKGHRTREKLCAGQTLVCRSLHLKVPEWNQKTTHKREFYVDDVGDEPSTLIQCRRLGIPEGRDEHLLLRFVDRDYASHCTSNPLTKRQWRENIDYHLIDQSPGP